MRRGQKPNLRGKVRKTTRCWIVHVEVIRGRNPVEVTNLALNLANRVADALRAKYGCVLGEGKIIAGEMAVEDPVASIFGRYFSVRTDKRKIDHSWSVGELEHLQRDAVVEYLRMPERIKNMESQLESRLGSIDRSLVRVTDILGKLVDVEGRDVRGNAVGGKGVPEYVT